MGGGQDWKDRLINPWEFMQQVEVGIRITQQRKRRRGNLTEIAGNRGAQSRQQQVLAGDVDRKIVSKKKISPQQWALLISQEETGYEDLTAQVEDAGAGAEDGDGGTVGCKKR